ncbi:unnamed protein product [Hymenolepis diminuta]|uniref:Uncharacterized protein n=1 Tax=Hymenolepis diminuta TaxID=6216 RepID=A0A3P6ZP02_HYMDI|nr:unnamed protein product [Hymenolepis diminuta]
MRQLLASQKKANALLQEQVSKGKFKSANANLDYMTLQKENQRLSSELEISRGKLNTMTTAWDHCFRRLLDENKKLQVNVANLQKTIKELQNKEKSDCSKCQNEESVEVASRAYSEEPNCGCSHAQQVRRLKEKVKELRIREANQHNRANDFEISLDAYKIALEKQFSENQTFIRKLSKVLEASHTNPEASDKPTETNDLSSCNDLTQWIEKALKSALEENGERIRKLSGGSRMSLNLESSYPTPSSSFSTRRHSFANSIQYSKRPVNGRVNEILEKLTEGRMEEYIHTERQKLLQDKNNRQFQILMTTTTA